MAHTQMLAAVGLIRPSRRRGFCPACRLFQSGDTPQEIAAPALLTVAFVGVAAVAWVMTVVRITSMDEMAMGLGAFDAFVVSWAVMMAAMMLPSALPLVSEFAQHAERRRGWQLATALLGVTYLGIWLAFGVICYALYTALGMPWPNQALVGGAALVVAGLYALTPLKRQTEAWCRERCALHGPLPFNLMRSAVVAGARYGLSCLGCSAGLMVALVLIGMSNLIWMIGFSALILVYKLGPAVRVPSLLTHSAVLVLLGVVYAMLA
jgi:predicted metal-binding membrane protein